MLPCATLGASLPPGPAPWPGPGQVPRRCGHSLSTRTTGSSQPPASSRASPAPGDRVDDPDRRVLRDGGRRHRPGGAKYAEEAAERDAQHALIEEERQQLALVARGGDSRARRALRGEGAVPRPRPGGRDGADRGGRSRRPRRRRARLSLRAAGRHRWSRARCRRARVRARARGTAADRAARARRWRVAVTFVAVIVSLADHLAHRRQGRRHAGGTDPGAELVSECGDAAHSGWRLAVRPRMISRRAARDGPRSGGGLRRARRRSAACARRRTSQRAESPR